MSKFIQIAFSDLWNGTRMYALDEEGTIWQRPLSIEYDEPFFEFHRSVPEGEGSSFDLVRHIKRQRNFSDKTFGPGKRQAGVIAHIKKELQEIEDTQGNLEEWVDVILLALDGAWRSGAEPEDVCRMLAQKQNKNELRQWPDWRTADPSKPIEHIEAQS